MRVNSSGCKKAGCSGFKSLLCHFQECDLGLAAYFFESKFLHLSNGKSNNDFTGFCGHRG